MKKLSFILGVIGLGVAQIGGASSDPTNTCYVEFSTTIMQL
jgi:hypothetical protein